MQPSIAKSYRYPRSKSSTMVAKLLISKVRTIYQILTRLELDCFVTVEPCIMCGYALKLAKIRKTFFILPNPKFGGLVSVLQISDILWEQIAYKEKQVLATLKMFYEDGNKRLKPEFRHRKSHAIESEGISLKRVKCDDDILDVKERLFKEDVKINSQGDNNGDLK